MAIKSSRFTVEKCELTYVHIMIQILYYRFLKRTESEWATYDI